MSSSSDPPDTVPSRPFGLLMRGLLMRGLLMRRLSMEPPLVRLSSRQSVPLAARSPTRNP
jgi:hypothetical protein